MRVAIMVSVLQSGAPAARSLIGLLCTAISSKCVKKSHFPPSLLILLAPREVGSDMGGKCPNMLWAQNRGRNENDHQPDCSGAGPRRNCECERGRGENPHRRRHESRGARACAGLREADRPQ